MSEIAPYILAEDGVDLRKTLIAPERASICQNLLNLDGIVSRAGNTRFVTGRLSAGNPMLGLHRFYRPSAPPQLIAASGTEIGARLDSDSVWTTVQTGRNPVNPVFFTTWLGRVYIVDGVNRPISWDGSAMRFEDFHDSGDAGTFISTTSFSVPNDRTSDYITGRKLCLNTSILVEVLSSSFGAGITTVTIVETTVPNPINGNIEFVGIPADVFQLIPYQDRLLGIRRGKGDLSWSGSFRTTSWEGVELTGVQPDTELLGLAIRSLTDSTFGTRSNVMLIGANGIYIFAGTDLRTPSTVGDYQIAQLTPKSLISVSPRTLSWTPRGNIILGADRQLYEIPFVGLTQKEAIPIPIGHRIFWSNSKVSGLKDIPISMLSKVTGIYHHGFYKMSYASKNSTVNDLQMWLNVDALKGEPGDIGPWFGPMVGHSFSTMLVLNGDQDNGQLIGGLDTESDILEIGKDGVTSDFNGDFFLYNDGTLYNKKSYSDEATKDIFTIYKTFQHPLSQEIGFNKDVLNVEFDLTDPQVRTTISLYDLNKVLGIDLTPIIGADGRFRIKSDYNVRNLSIEIKWNSADFSFKLIALLVNKVTRKTPLEEI